MRPWLCGVALLQLLLPFSACVSLPDVYTLQMNGQDATEVGFTVYTYYVAQLAGNYMARTDTVDANAGIWTNEWSFWSGKEGSPVQHFTFQMDGQGAPTCSLEETEAPWSPPLSLDSLVYVGKQAPSAAYADLDTYMLNYTTNGVDYVDTWYFYSEFPVYMSTRPADDTEDDEYVISYRPASIDQLKPFFDLPSACENATRSSGSVSHPRHTRATESPPFCTNRQTRCCVYLLESDKGHLIFHNNVGNRPSCQPKSGSATLCNERCVSSLFVVSLTFSLWQIS